MEVYDRIRSICLDLLFCCFFVLKCKEDKSPEKGQSHLLWNIINSAITSKLKQSSPSNPEPFTRSIW